MGAVLHEELEGFPITAEGEKKKTKRKWRPKERGVNTGKKNAGMESSNIRDLKFASLEFGVRGLWGG